MKPPLIVTLRAHLPWHARLLLPFILAFGRFPRVAIQISDDSETKPECRIFGH